MTLWMSRARLKRDASIAALAPMLLPAEEGARAGAAHRLVWSLFAEDPSAPRDFLWRDRGEGAFMVMSAREPQATHPLLDIETKPFAPKLMAGMRLGFDLRINPTVDRRTGPRQSTRDDVVMAMLHAMPTEARAEARERLATEATHTWLAARGASSGYAPDDLQVISRGYRIQHVPRTGADGRQKKPIRIGIVDVTGTLTITDPDAFLARLSTGFGRAKAFGYGLMLIRRA